ncbi:MAG: hypothetical protein DRN05_07530 [Thermoplasmata archaeon]|nr:MAG: hypothetical protein DRN05_07530 [Thermoplasmata archaeon]
MKRYLRDILILAFHVSGLAAARRRVIRRHRNVLVRVICFHRVEKESIPLLTQKLLWLKAHCNIITLDDLDSLDRLDTKLLNVAITFDDGFRDFLTNVFPVLTHLGVPATLFAPSDFVGLGRGEALEFARTCIGIPGEVGLKASDLRFLANSRLVTIGAHGKSHTDLAREPSMDSVRAEIAGAKRDLEAIIGREVKYFAYPFGNRWNCDSRCFEVLDESGYRMAFTIVPGFNWPNAYQWTMRRDSLDPRMPLILFKAWLDGAYDRLKDAADYIRGHRFPDNGLTV